LIKNKAKLYILVKCNPLPTSRFCNIELNINPLTKNSKSKLILISISNAKIILEKSMVF